MGKRCGTTEDGSHPGRQVALKKGFWGEVLGMDIQGNDPACSDSLCNIGKVPRAVWRVPRNAERASASVR